MRGAACRLSASALGRCHTARMQTTMARAAVASSVLFWLMLLTGAAVLAPCLLLPAWLEQQAEREWLAAYQAHVAALEYRLRSVQKQIEHLQHDPAYMLRLAQQDFGELKVPNVETIRIEPSPQELGADTATEAAPESAPELLPELASFIDDLLRRHPRAAAFLDQQVRPWLLGSGSGLILAALACAGWAKRASASRASPATDTAASENH